MTYSGRLTWGLVIWAASFAAWGQSELLVQVKPANKALKANVEGYIGSLGDRDEEALLRFSRGAEEQARKAAQALGYYQAQIDSEVKPASDADHSAQLILSINPGEPIRLRNVTVRIEGPASDMKAFRVPDSRALREAMAAAPAGMRRPLQRLRRAWNALAREPGPDWRPLEALPAALARFAEVYLAHGFSPRVAMLRRLLVSQAGRPGFEGGHYDLGAAHTMAALTRFLRGAMDAGRLREADPTRAALHLKGLLEAEWSRRYLFETPPALTPEQIERTTASALPVFMAAYGPPGAAGALPAATLDAS